MFTLTNTKVKRSNQKTKKKYMLKNLIIQNNLFLPKITHLQTKKEKELWFYSKIVFL
jgi:hypothetical protein